MKRFAAFSFMLISIATTGLQAGNMRNRRRPMQRPMMSIDDRLKRIDELCKLSTAEKKQRLERRRRDGRGRLFGGRGPLTMDQKLARLEELCKMTPEKRRKKLEEIRKKQIEMDKKRRAPQRGKRGGGTSRRGHARGTYYR